MKEYLFDVRLDASVKVKADSEAQARDAVAALCRGIEPTEPFLYGFNNAAKEVEVTEFTLSPDNSIYDDGAELIEVDGEVV